MEGVEGEWGFGRVGMDGYRARENCGLGSLGTGLVIDGKLEPSSKWWLDGLFKESERV